MSGKHNRVLCLGIGTLLFTVLLSFLVLPIYDGFPRQARVTAIRQNHLLVYEGKRNLSVRNFEQQIYEDLFPWNDGVHASSILSRYKSHGGELALLINNNLHVTEKVGQRAKRSLWIRMMKMLLKRMSAPNVMFLIQFGSTPKDRSSSEPAAPLFSMSKSANHIDILYPNPYFGQYLQKRRGLLNAAKLPWGKRIALGFWRGACRGSRSRAELVRQRQSGVLDAAVTSKCRVEEWPLSDREWVRHLAKTNKYTLSTMAKYKFLIVMPGSTAGSYSKAMQYLSTLGSVILFWENDFYEFYYKELEHGTHLLKVNRSNLIPTIRYLQANDEYARDIAINLHHWIKRRLDEKHIRSYYEKLLWEYRKLQKFPCPQTLAEVVQ